MSAVATAQKRTLADVSEEELRSQSLRFRVTLPEHPLLSRMVSVIRLQGPDSAVVNCSGVSAVLPARSLEVIRSVSGNVAAGVTAAESHALSLALQGGDYVRIDDSKAQDDEERSLAHACRSAYLVVDPACTDGFSKIALPPPHGTTAVRTALLFHAGPNPFDAGRRPTVPLPIPAPANFSDWSPPQRVALECALQNSRNMMLSGAAAAGKTAVSALVGLMLVAHTVITCFLLDMPLRSSAQLRRLLRPSNLLGSRCWSRCCPMRLRMR
jgi:hypothetical protein